VTGKQQWHRTLTQENNNDIEPLHKVNKSDIEPLHKENNSDIEPLHKENNSDIEPLHMKTIVNNAQGKQSWNAEWFLVKKFSYTVFLCVSSI
jgi:hypothetical protein